LKSLKQKRAILASNITLFMLQMIIGMSSIQLWKL